MSMDFPPYTENQRLLDSINEAYADRDPEEEKFQKAVQKKSFEVFDEWK